MKEYRIRKVRSDYIIEIKQVDIIYTGMLWWAKSTETITWHTVSAYGSCINRASRYSWIDPQVQFNTLDEAIKQIDIFNSKDEYYYPPDYIKRFEP